MAGKRVPFITAEGDFGTVDESEAKKLPAGARVLTAKEEAKREVDARYAALPTSRKALGVVNAVTGMASPLTIGNDPASPPTVAAFGAGARQGATAGMFDAGVRQAVNAVGGKAKGDAYAAQVEQEQTASPTAHALGDITGMVGGSVLGGEAGAGRALPSAGISAIGEAVEQGTGRVLGGLAGRGALGRAAVSGAELGARGAVEGGAYSGIQAASDALLHDQELSADKIFAATGSGILVGGLGGAALGAGGSLVKSGANAMLGGDLVARAGSAVAKGAQEEAYKQTFKAMAGGMGLSPTRPIKLAGRMFDNVAADLGEIGVRNGVIDMDAGVGSAFANGKAADMVPRALEAQERVGRRIGELTAASGAVIPASKIESIINRVAEPFEGKAGQRHIGASVRDYGAELRDVLGLSGGAESVPVQSLLEQRKALDQVVYQETKALDPKMRVQALRDVRAGLEDAVTDAMDASSGQVAGVHKAEYQALKRDYVGLNIINDILEDSAARQTKAATFGLSSMIGGAATGHIGTGLLAATGIKMAKERGAAVAAVLLHNAANSETLLRLVGKTNNEIAAASRGLLTSPPKALLEAPKGAPRVRAQQVMKLIASLQADPETTTARLAQQTEGVEATSPELAQSLMQRHVQALTFLASKVPVANDPDPLDPHPAPRMTDGEAATFARYAWYTEKPSRFFTEVAHGKLTPEGAETAAALMPRAFAELQERTLDALATHMSRGRSVSFQQRLKIGTILDIPAVPSQRPDHMLTLQQNVQPAPGDLQNKGPKKSSGGGGMGSQKGALDRLEERGPGR